MKLKSKRPEEEMSKKNPPEIAKINPEIFIRLSKRFKSKTTIKTIFKTYPLKSKKTRKLFWKTVKK